MRTALRSGLIGATLCLGMWAAACGGAKEEAAPPPVVSNPVDPATAGNITGTIHLEGTPPAEPPINLSSDPYCEQQGAVKPEAIAVGTGAGLQNVFVYVKDGLGDRKFPVPATSVVLDQKGCRYAPHVLGIQVGQTLEIASSDNTLHNIHAIPEQNREFNLAQQFAGMKHTHVFSAKEVMVPFKCDVHGWMNAHAAVLDHPFFAVSAKDGKFEIKGVPPGKYTIEAVHEKLGAQTIEVEVAAKDSKAADFTFKMAS